MTVKRWTDEMLDRLALSVEKVNENVLELSRDVSELRSSITEMREDIVELTINAQETNKSIEGLQLTAQALLQLAAQSQRQTEQFEEEMELNKQRQAENDERFNVLLEEVRYLIRRQEN